MRVSKLLKPFKNRNAWAGEEEGRGAGMAFSLGVTVILLSLLLIAYTVISNGQKTIADQNGKQIQHENDSIRSR